MFLPADCKDVMLLPENLFLYILSTQFYFILFITVTVTTILTCYVLETFNSSFL